MFDQELTAFLSLGGKIHYNSPVTKLIYQNNKVIGVLIDNKSVEADAVILASGGFEANDELRKLFIGDDWLKAKVRGTPNNTGDGLKMALDIGATKHGLFDGCHATRMRSEERRVGKECRSRWSPYH